MKAALTTFWVTLISFSSKVMGRLEQKWWSRSQPEINDVQLLYWVPPPDPTSATINAIKWFQYLFTIIILIIWIFNYTKIRKIEDKAEKNKKTKKTIIILLAILIAILLMSVAIRLLKKYNI